MKNFEYFGLLSYGEIMLVLVTFKTWYLRSETGLKKVLLVLKKKKTKSKVTTTG